MSKLSPVSPETIVCFLEASDFEGGMRNAIKIGGDSDTQAAITGSIAEAKWSVPAEIRREALGRMDEGLFETYQRFLSQCRSDREPRT